MIIRKSKAVYLVSLISAKTIIFSTAATGANLVKLFKTSPNNYTENSSNTMYLVKNDNHAIPSFKLKVSEYRD